MGCVNFSLEIEITVYIMVFLVVFKFFVFVSEVVSIFSKILIWIFFGKRIPLLPTQILGARGRAAPPQI